MRCARAVLGALRAPAGGATVEVREGPARALGAR
jgi:hypothetical protein